MRPTNLDNTPSHPALVQPILGTSAKQFDSGLRSEWGPMALLLREVADLADLLEPAPEVMEPPLPAEVEEREH